jgi:predicted DNA-binding transcriptional regulator AlpA
MTNPLIEEKEIQLARAMSDQTIARIKIAAAILGITPKHLHELAKRPDFPAKVRIGSNAVGWRVTDLEAWIEKQVHTGGSNNAS